MQSLNSWPTLWLMENFNFWTLHKINCPNISTFVIFTGAFLSFSWSLRVLNCPAITFRAVKKHFKKAVSTTFIKEYFNTGENMNYCKVWTKYSFRYVNKWLKMKLLSLYHRRPRNLCCVQHSVSVSTPQFYYSCSFAIAVIKCNFLPIAILGNPSLHSAWPPEDNFSNKGDFYQTVTWHSLCLCWCWCRQQHTAWQETQWPQSELDSYLFFLTSIAKNETLRYNIAPKMLKSPQVVSVSPSLMSQDTERHNSDPGTDIYQWRVARIHCRLEEQCLACQATIIQSSI